MVDIVVSRPGGGLDVTRRNPRSTLYVTTDPDFNPIPVPDSHPNGSIRFVKIPDTNSDPEKNNERFVRLQQKTEGVWNTTGLSLSSGSVELGKNLTLEGAAHFLKTENSGGTDDHESALIPHIDFADTGSGFTHSPVVDEVFESVFYDNVNPNNEFIGTLSEQFYDVTFAQIIQRIVYRSGTVSATATLNHKIFQGTDNTGLLIHELNLPAEHFFAQTEITSVTDSGGKARFNFTVGPTLTLGQTLSLVGFIEKVDYNTVDTVSATGAGFFELENELFEGNETIGIPFFSGSVIELNSDFGFSAEQVDIFIEISSPANFSLQRNSAASPGPNVLTSFKTQKLLKIDLIMDELVLNEALDIVIDNDLNFVTHNRFP